MKKSIVLFVFLLLLGKLVLAQGIVFETGSWEEALAKAKKENKVLFVDVYTSWCAPCKVVAKTVFPQKEVGDFYNQNFINYQIDGEKGEGPAVVKKYNVTAYPTFLFINGDGELVYRFMGGKDVNGFLAEGDKVSLCAGFGGWEKMQADYKNGNVGPDFLWAYYQLVDGEQKSKVLNQYLKSLPDEKLFTVEIGKMMDNDDMRQYDYDLMKRMIEGRVKLGEQGEEFNFFFTFGLQMMMTHYINQSIEKGDEAWFEELLGLKKIFNQLPGTSDPDIRMILGRGAFFASDDFLRLRFMYANGNNDGQFKQLLEVYMYRLISQNPLDSVAAGRSRVEGLMQLAPELSSLLGSHLPDENQLICSYIIDFTDYYWRIMPSDRQTREHCAKWLGYICQLNPYSARTPMKAAGLFCRLKHKKDAENYLVIAIEKQKLLQGKDPAKSDEMRRKEFKTTLRLLENTIRDVKNDKI